MYQCSVSVIHVERTAGAAFFPLRTEHEVIHDKLASAVEEVGKSFFAAGRIEHIVLFDFDPGELAAFGGIRVGLGSELLLFGTYFLSSRKPFISRHYLRVID